MKRNTPKCAALLTASVGLVTLFAPSANAQSSLTVPLLIGGNATPPASLPNNGKGLLLGSRATFQWIQTYGGPLILNSNGGQGAGNSVGIGLTNPTWTLDVAGTIRGTGDGPHYVSPGVIGRSSSEPGVWGISTNGYGVYGKSGNIGVRAEGVQTGIFASVSSQQGFAGAFLGNVVVSGNLQYTGTLTRVSDARYKTNVQPLGNALETIENLRGVTYDYKRGDFPQMNFPATRQVGFIAQEVQSVLPQLVSKDRDGYLSVDYVQVVPVLVEALKEQQKAIAAQQKELAALKRENQRVIALEARLTALTARITQAQQVAQK